MKFLRKLFIIAFLFAWVTATAAQAQAALLKFDKADYSVDEGETFNVEVIVNPGSDQITSIDAHVMYDNTIINVDNVTEGTYFPTVLNQLNAGHAYIAGLVDSPTEFKTGTGTVATVVFKAVKEGETDLVFDCDDQETVTSKVIKNDVNSTNIIVCDENGTATVTINVVGSTDDTTDEETTEEDTTTSTGGTDDTPTPTRAPVTQLPASGTTENMLLLGSIGAVLVMVGGAAKLMKSF